MTDETTSSDDVVEIGDAADVPQAWLHIASPEGDGIIDLAGGVLALKVEIVGGPHAGHYRLRLDPLQ